MRSEFDFIYLCQLNSRIFFKKRKERISRNISTIFLIIFKHESITLTLLLVFLTNSFSANQKPLLKNLTDKVLLLAVTNIYFPIKTQ